MAKVQTENLIVSVNKLVRSNDVETEIITDEYLAMIESVIESALSEVGLSTVVIEVFKDE